MSLWGVLIFSFAFVVRYIHLESMKEHPLFLTPVGPDSIVYQQLGEIVASGNWLLDIPLCKTLKMSPLYPYILAAIYKVFGTNFYVVRLVQMTVGALGCMLTFLIARRVLGLGGGIVAGALQSVYAPLVFFEPHILNEVWVVGVNLLCVLFLIKADKEGGWWWVALGGFFLGLSAILRANVLLFSPFVVLWFFLRYHRGNVRWLWILVGLGILSLAGVFPRHAVAVASLTCVALVVSKRLRENRVLKYSVAFYLGMEMAVFPVTLRNYIMGGEWVILTTNLGPELYMGSSPEAKGISYMTPEFVTPHPLLISEHFLDEARRRTANPKLSYEGASRFWIGETLLEIYNKPLKFLNLVGRKVFYFFNNFESTDNTFYEFERRLSPVLSLPLPTFGVMCAFGLAGMVIMLGSWRENLLLYGMVVAYFASAMLAVVMARYRLPSTPFLIIFASVVPYSLVRLVRERRTRSVVMVVVGVVVVMAVSFHRSPMILTLKRERLAVGHRKLALRYAKLGEYRKAGEHTKQAIVLLPRQARNLLVWNADYGLEGPFSLAIEEFEKRVRESPTEPGNHGILAYLYNETGNLDKAIEETRKMLEIEKEDFSYTFFLVYLLWKRGCYEEARDVLKKIVFRKSPSSPLGHYYLGRICESEAERARKLGKTESARLKEEEAREAYILSARWRSLVKRETAEFYSYWARHAYRLQKYEDAVENFRASLYLRPNVAKRLLWLGLSLAKLGKYAPASGYLFRAYRLNPDIMAYYVTRLKIMRLEKALKSEPKNGKLYLELSEIYLDNFWVPEALRSARKASEFLPDLPEPYKLMGRCYELMGKELKAETAYAIALSCGEDEFARENLEKLRLARALRAKKSVELRVGEGKLVVDPSSPEPYVRLAELCHKYGQEVRALEILDSAERLIVEKSCAFHRRVFRKGLPGRRECDKGCERLRKLVERIYEIRAEIYALREQVREARKYEKLFRKLSG